MSRVITEDKSFELFSNESILEGLERTGHLVEYQCRSGYCGSCRVKKLLGEVCYLLEPLAFIMPGEILTCCSRPKTDIILEIKTPDNHEI